MDNTTRPAEEEGGNLRRPVGYRAVWQSTSDGYVWDGASSRVVPTMRQAQEIIEQWNAMGLVSDALECRVQTLYEDATAAPGAAAAAPEPRNYWADLWYFVMDEAALDFESIVTNHQPKHWLGEAHKLFRAKYPARAAQDKGGEA